jgi:phosphomannomutase
MPSEDTLRSRLAYQPVELQFGTSGRRGKVVDLSPLEIYANVTGELRYLQQLAREQGGVQQGDEFPVAHDHRPSSTRLVPQQQDRGEIAQAVLRALVDAGMKPVNMGAIPTPALAHYALARRQGCIMVTGSHIPYDRNGFKTYTSAGELLKEQEAPINASVGAARDFLYQQSFAESIFDERGRFKTGSSDLPPVSPAAREAYIERYSRFFGEAGLAGMRLMVYEHSAVGADILAELLQCFGADVVRRGRTADFVPIDTENIEPAQLALIQSFVDETPVDAVVSTDGDSDRPLVIGVDAKSNRVRFFPGDLIGIVVAQYLGADAVVVPVSCNDALDRTPLAAAVEPRTRIGSPYVLAGIQAAIAKGRSAVCGWEPNGGFLLGSDVEREGRVLRALPTRDAILPILAVLFAARERGADISSVFDALPPRFGKSRLVKDFPREKGRAIVERLPNTADDLSRFFDPAVFTEAAATDRTDGVRIRFRNEDIVHLRPSGNADEFRVYALSDDAGRADWLSAEVVREPDGVLRTIEMALTRR